MTAGTPPPLRPSEPPPPREGRGRDRILACPVCFEELVGADGSALRCRNAHSFDVAREGYVNLLLAQHRRSKDPGYSVEMMRGRRRFFDSGHYEPLADALAELIDHHLGADDPLVVDAGCGEGYYLRRLDRRLARTRPSRPVTRCGFDISKHGIKLAARSDPSGLYAVASTYRAPILAASVEVLITHFSPVSPADFLRVLRPGGVALVGGPGEGHLFGLKRLIYLEPEPNRPKEALEDTAGLELIDIHRVRYPISIGGPGQVGDLLLMTPYYWSVSAEVRDRLATMDALETAVDVQVHAYRRT